ncbi:MAG: glucuronate isomerase [Cyclobacteriaceae bacterium]
MSLNGSGTRDIGHILSICKNTVTAILRYVYDQTTERLLQKDFSSQGLLKKMKVEVVCTSDDPISDLKHHRNFSKEGKPLQMKPTFRPDRAYDFDNEYLQYLEDLGAAAGHEINSLDALLEALKKRLIYFHQHGCSLSDHGLDQLHDVDYSFGQSSLIFEKILSGKSPAPDEAKVLTMTLLLELSKLYHEYGWAQQFHLGAVRNVNSRIVKALGKDAGVDSISDNSQISGLARFLDELDQRDQLAKTIIYNLNSADNDAMATMLGNFNDGSLAGKMQYGAAWWFLDQKDGIEKQLDTLSNMGLLSRFVGMLTDSRSFLSFPRHEYFRRILCNKIGKEVEKGELPNDLNFLGNILKGICYDNAKSYFNF